MSQFIEKIKGILDDDQRTTIDSRVTLQHLLQRYRVNLSFLSLPEEFISSSSIESESWDRHSATNDGLSQWIVPTRDASRSLQSGLSREDQTDQCRLDESQSIDLRSSGCQCERLNEEDWRSRSSLLDIGTSQWSLHSTRSNSANSLRLGRRTNVRSGVHASKNTRGRCQSEHQEMSSQFAVHLHSHLLLVV